MTNELPVRRLMVDLDAPFERHWAGGDPFRTAVFNALSMSFPVGEQFFIDSVRAGLTALPLAEKARFEAEVKGFIGQEATHRRIHGLFNQQLERQGLVNHWAPRILRRIRRLQGVDLRAAVAVTAATEHFTAILAEYVLHEPRALQGAEPRLRLLWEWHAAEESEHRSTAFDLYRALHGSERWRLRLFKLVTWHFLTDVLRQTLNNLWHDGTWKHWSTWREGWRFLFGAGGVVPTLREPWCAYLAADFHPSKQGGAAGVAWLARHGSDYTLVGRPAGAAAGA